MGCFKNQQKGDLSEILAAYAADQLFLSTLQLRFTAESLLSSRHPAMLLCHIPSSTILQHFIALQNSFQESCSRAGFDKPISNCFETVSRTL